MDHRDLANLKEDWYESFDEDKMIAIVELDEIDVDEDERAELLATPGVTIHEDDSADVNVPMKFEVCGTCNGKGSHVNPSIDSHGLTYDDFADDPDFERDYRRGRYDVGCYECDGKRVVPVLDEKIASKLVIRLINERMEFEAMYANERAREMEMGY